MLVRLPLAHTASGVTDRSSAADALPRPSVTSVAAELRTVALAAPVSLTTGPLSNCAVVAAHAADHVNRNCARRRFRRAQIHRPRTGYQQLGSPHPAQSSPVTVTGELPLKFICSAAPTDLANASIASIVLMSAPTTTKSERRGYRRTRRTVMPFSLAIAMYVYWHRQSILPSIFDRAPLMSMFKIPAGCAGGEVERLACSEVEAGRVGRIEYRRASPIGSPCFAHTCSGSWRRCSGR